MKNASPKVVVIGLDGATFALLRPWMEAGVLPYLKSLMDEGGHGSLESSVPPVTSPAWQCLMTGKNPGKLGITGFFEQRPEVYEGSLVGTLGGEGTTFWEILSRAGKRVAMLNVPFTAPPLAFNGVLIGGFTTPPSQKSMTFYPPELLKELEERFGEYRMDLNTPPLLLINRSTSLIEEFIEDCEALTQHQFQAATYILDREEFDVVMFYQLIIDRIQHRLWHLLDETHPWHDPEVARRFSDRIVAYYRRLDAQIAHLVQKVGTDPTVLVLSDHGFGPVVKGIDLNSWLLKEGYIQIRRHPLSQIKLLLWKLGWGPYSFVTTFLRRAVSWPGVRRWLTKTYSSKSTATLQAELGRAANRFFLSLQDIDWSRTKAYCQIGPGLIRINLQGREPRGIVKPEAYRALREELVQRLHALADPTTGRTIRARVVTRDEVYHGKYLDQMPDIVYMAFEAGYLAGNPVAFHSNKIVVSGLGPSGFHRMDGILLAKGRHLRKAVKINGASIMDIAPTLLYLMGSEVPKDMDGRVLTEIFKEEFVDAHPIVYGETVCAGEHQRVGISPEDQALLMERLKGLGYID